jgi:hypothetical protein
MGAVLDYHYNVLACTDVFSGLCWISKGIVPDMIVVNADQDRRKCEQFIEHIGQSRFFNNIPILLALDVKSTFISDMTCSAQHGIIHHPYSPVALEEKIREMLGKQKRTFSPKRSVQFFRFRPNLWHYKPSAAKSLQKR